MIFFKKYRKFKDYYREQKNQFKIYYKGDFDLEYEKEIKEIRYRCKEHYFFMRDKVYPKTFGDLLSWQYSDIITDIIKSESDRKSLLDLIPPSPSFQGGTLKVPLLKDLK